MGDGFSIGAFLWASPLRKFATSVTTACAMVVGLHQAVPVLEPWWPASRSYAQDVIASIEGRVQSAEQKGYAAIRDLQIELAEGKREQADRELFQWTMELSRINDDQAKVLIQDHIRKMNATRDRLTDQINSLNKAKYDP